MFIGYFVYCKVPAQFQTVATAIVIINVQYDWLVTYFDVKRLVQY